MGTRGDRLEIGILGGDLSYISVNGGEGRSTGKKGNFIFSILLSSICVGNGEGRSGNFHFYAIFTLLSKSMRREGRNKPSFDNFHLHTIHFVHARLVVAVWGGFCTLKGAVYVVLL